MNTKNKLLPSLLVNAFLFQKISLKDIVSGGRPSVAEALQAHASVICLQHPSLPSHSAAEQVSLKKKKKKKVSSIIPFVSGRKPDTEETSKQKKL